MKKVIIIILVLLIGCASNKLKIKLDSDSCQDVQVFLDLADDLSGWFDKDSNGSTMALTLATGAYTNCLNERRKK